MRRSSPTPGKTVISPDLRLTSREGNSDLVRDPERTDQWVSSSSDSSIQELCAVQPFPFLLVLQVPWFNEICSRRVFLVRVPATVVQIYQILALLQWCLRAHGE